MSLDAWLAVATVLAVFCMLAFTRVAPYLILLGAAVLLMILGVIDTSVALAGFSNPGMITVGALFVVAAGLGSTGALAMVIGKLLGRPRTVRGAMWRLVLPVTASSAFLNNTPIVAMLIPVIGDWSQRIRVPASKLLLPLSYAAILGGLCTLIGTSTNMVVHGLLIDAGHEGLDLFSITPVGLACAAAGVAFLILVGHRLLPSHAESMQALDDPREYTLEMVVEAGGALVDRTVEQAGVRTIPGLFLVEIHRGGLILPVVGPEVVLEVDDQLIFAGSLDAVLELQKLPGLRPASRAVFSLEAPRSERCFVEAVLGSRSPLIGQTVRQARFRHRYNAVVIAVARHGERIEGRIDEVRMQPGDTLLLETLPSFVDAHKNSRHFLLVSRIDDVAPPRHERVWVAIGIMVAMVAAAGFGVLSMLEASLLAGAAMLITGCLSEGNALRSIDWPLLIAIASSFALGTALESSGAAATIVGALLSRLGDNPLLALAGIYLVTTVFTEMITNNAAAVLVFPIAMATAAQLGVSHMPFVAAVMMAASASFATPLGYQTNLMVYGVGGYQFKDFLRLGIPMNIIMGGVTVALAPIVFPF